MTSNNTTTTEYDGSTSTRVLINKLISVSSVDNAPKRVKIRFDVLQKERAEIKDQFNNETDLEVRTDLVDADESKAAELTKLLEAKNQLEVKRQELIDARAEEVRNYKPSKKTWA